MLSTNKSQEVSKGKCSKNKTQDSRMPFPQPNTIVIVLSNELTKEEINMKN